MTQYNVTGMSCAACSARVEKAVSKVPGVSACSVSLLTNSMGVDGTASPEAVVAAVQAAGYGASLKGAAQAAPSAAEAEEALADHETPALRRRLLWSVGFLLVLMYFSMGHMMWGWPLPAFYDGNHVAMGLTQMLLTIIIMVINRKFFVSGFKSLWHRAPNMDSLIALGSAAAMVYGIAALFQIAWGMGHGSDYGINDPETALVVSAQYQVLMAEALLSNNAEMAQKVIKEADLVYPDKKDYFAAVDKIFLDKKAVTQNEDGTITLDFQNI